MFDSLYLVLWMNSNADLICFQYRVNWQLKIYQNTMSWEAANVFLGGILKYHETVTIANCLRKPRFFRLCGYTKYAITGSCDFYSQVFQIWMKIPSVSANNISEISFISEVFYRHFLVVSLCVLINLCSYSILFYFV